MRKTGAELSGRARLDSNRALLEFGWRGDVPGLLKSWAWTEMKPAHA